MLRIAYLCKRFYMNKDVVADRYARLYEHARYLAENGDEVNAYCLAYYASSRVDERHKTSRGKLTWKSWYVGFLFWRFPIIFLALSRILIQRKPDHIAAGSDQIHIILGFIYSKLLSTTFSVDLYDNFESYGIGKIPFLNCLFRWALGSADIVTCVSPHLLQKIKPLVSSDCTLDVLLSTVDGNLFKPLAKKECRKVLNLPENVILVGTAGNLRKMMDIDTVYQAFEILNIRKQKVIFVVAGTADPDSPVPVMENLINLGQIDHHKIPLLFNSLDVGIIYQSLSQYGIYAFPQKALEMAACHLPIVAADVGSIKEIFADNKSYLYESGNPISLAGKIEQQISDQFITRTHFENWETQGLRLHNMINAVRKKD